MPRKQKPVQVRQSTMLCTLLILTCGGVVLRRNKAHWKACEMLEKAGINTKRQLRKLEVKMLMQHSQKDILISTMDLKQMSRGEI